MIDCDLLYLGGGAKNGLGATHIKLTPLDASDISLLQRNFLNAL